MQATRRTTLLLFLYIGIVGVLSATSALANPCPNGEVLITDQTRATARAAGIPDSSQCWNPNSQHAGMAVGQAKEYLDSLPKRPLSNCAPPVKENIMRLNDTFAVCAAAFFKAYTAQYGTVYITSAYRDGPSGANACAGGAPGSNHMRGVAMDVNPASESMYPTMWKFASDNPQFGVCFPFQDGRTGSIRDRPHIVLGGIGGSEGALCARQGVSRPCSGLSFTPTSGTSTPQIVPPIAQQPYSPSPTAGLANQIRQAVGGNQQPSGFGNIGSIAQPTPSLPLPTQSQFCVPEYVCSGNSVAFKNSFCATQVQQTCPGGCSNGACINASSTNTNVNENTNQTSTNSLDILGYLSGVTATSSSIATATPLQLISSLQNQQALATTSQQSVLVPTQNILSLQPAAQQTFTSPDLNPHAAPSYAQTNQTGIFGILQNMRTALLVALNYLRPFSPIRYDHGDGHT